MTLTLRNVPDLIHQLLKQQAQEHRRSLNQEALAVFERALVPKKKERTAEVSRIVAETNEARSRMNRFMTDDEISDAIEDGRA